jgi:hypothetical protein
VVCSEADLPGVPHRELHPPTVGRLERLAREVGRVVVESPVDRGERFVGRRRRGPAPDADQVVRIVQLLGQFGRDQVPSLAHQPLVESVLDAEIAVTHESALLLFRQHVPIHRGDGHYCGGRYRRCCNRIQVQSHDCVRSNV